MPETDQQNLDKLELRSMAQIGKYELLSTAVTHLQIVRLAMTGENAFTEPDRSTYRISRHLQLEVTNPFEAEHGTVLEIKPIARRSGMPYVQLGHYGSRLVMPSMNTFFDEENFNDIDSPQEMLDGSADRYTHRAVHFAILAETAHKYVRKQMRISSRPARYHY